MDTMWSRGSHLSRPAGAGTTGAGVCAPASEALDLLRGLAAVFVMIGHVRGLYFVPWDRVAEPSLPLRAIYFLTGLGHEAVMVFFVLSGYFIAANVLGARERGTWNWGWYLTRRVTRLAIVLWPALLAGLLLDGLGLSLFGEGGPYGAGEEYRHILAAPVAERLAPEILLGNALFVQEILTPTFGSNGPLWSLSFEFWYYLIFPCLVLAAGAGAPAWRRAGWLALALAMLAFVGPVIALYFLIWLAGAGVYRLSPRLRRARGTAEWLLWLVPALALMLAALAASASGALPRTAADFAVAAGCAAVVLALSRGPERTGAGQPAWGRGARFLAGFSYTLYLTHLPLLVLGQAWVVQAGGGRWQPDALHLGLGLGLAGAALAYAWLFSLATEARTDALRRLVFERRVAAG